MEAKEREIFILSATSDIGTYLAESYAKAGHPVYGTYRTVGENLGKLLTKNLHLDLVQCDLSSKKDIEYTTRTFGKLEKKWQTFISCPCDPIPLKPFFESDFDRWEKSVEINSLRQLEFLHQMWPYRKDGEVNVVFFAGAGTNNSVENFSAYVSSKIHLIKMCELLDAENPEGNFFIVGPGWTRTKTHDLILKNTEKNDPRYKQTKEFLESEEGTKMGDIFKCIETLRSMGKPIVGGRNFSVVHDKWESEDLMSTLYMNPEMYKLRRVGNNWENKK